MKKNSKVILIAFILLLVLKLTGTAQDISTGLVAHYEFENTTGDVVDAAGSHTGTNYGATRGVPGKVGNAFCFDGGDYVTINNHSDITDYAAFTLTAWVNPTTLSSSKTIISKVSPNRDFNLKFSSTNISAHYAAGSTYYSCNSATTVSTNNWIHAAAVYENNSWKIYYNGVLDNSCSFFVGPPWSGGTMQIGAMANGENFVGLIDEVRVYSRALSAIDITALYNYTGGGTLPSLSVIDVGLSEEDQDGGILVRLNEVSAQTVSGSYSTSDGTAIAGLDYEAVSNGTFSISAGVLQQQLDINLINDTEVESKESFSVTISNVTNATISDATGICEITDDDLGLTCSNTVTSYPYSESFESSSNSWINATGDNMDWTRKSGSTGSTGTGPTSAQNGSYYYYTEASNYLNLTAILESSCFDLSGESSAEFSFYYHMYGSYMGTLKLEATTDGINWTTLWSKSGNQGNEWLQAVVNLGVYLGDIVKLRFNGTTGSSYTSDMAIDNVSLTTGAIGVTSVNSYVGNVQLNLGLSSNNLSISGGNSISLPYGTGDITAVAAGTGLTGGGTAGDLTISAQNTSALWNANAIQGVPVSTTGPTIGQVLKFNGTEWVPSIDDTGSGSSLWSESGSDIYFDTSTGGKVGIGTSLPDEVLTVAGNIHAEEVVVETSIPAPDYVFGADYQLRTIRELEEYLDTHCHLPDIPSAKEMEENGISLSTLNLMLLKRIEELTLYLIDQEKRIQVMEAGKE